MCIDLCAAPGGWCQVAARHMPSESVILGIDLLPIRPIRNVKTLVQDITTAVSRGLRPGRRRNGRRARVLAVARDGPAAHSACCATPLLLVRVIRNAARW